MSTEQKRPDGENDSVSTPGNAIPASIEPQRIESFPISLLTIGRFLIGRRQAILRVAYSKTALWLGLAFVLLAGFFREYDQEDLLREPWHLFLPLGASLVLTLALYILVKIAWPVRPYPDPEWEEALQLLRCLWMCAPMAVLYAIPVEHLFDSARDAIVANVVFLGVVSVWRVSLMTRVISVLWDVPWWKALFPVMLLSDTLAIGLMMAMPLPLIQIMGGIQLSDAEQVINGVRLNVIGYGILTYLIWLIGTFVLWVNWRKPEEPSSRSVDGDIVVAPSCWVFIGLLASGVLYGTMLMQPKQQLRYAIEQELKSNNIAAGFSLAAEHSRAALPPHWEPPPRIGYGEREPDIVNVIDYALTNPDAPAWLLDAYARKLVQLRGVHYQQQWFWNRFDDDELRVLVRLLKEHPQWREKLDGGEYGTIRSLVKSQLDKESWDADLLNALLDVSIDPPAEDDPLRIQLLADGTTLENGENREEPTTEDTAAGEGNEGVSDD